MMFLYFSYSLERKKILERGSSYRNMDRICPEKVKQNYLLERANDQDNIDLLSFHDINTRTHINGQNSVVDF